MSGTDKPNHHEEMQRKRLSTALRENLKRRKAQARGRRATSADAEAATAEDEAGDEALSAGRKGDS